ncbi:MAG: glutamate-1-semialdehyde 2,1-aminomutase [Candidatus Omnitrophica bacterium]|nr:glutamate-1-semialdehyde 2,1-aminomutase [Candidatus Omnitrophota bacterium]
MTLAHSKRLFERGSKSLVGSVNSPVRSFNAVQTPMLFAQKANGAHVWDTDGNKYIDYIMSWGVGILGHAYKPVVDAAITAMKNGSSFGLATEREIELAEKIKQHMKSIDKVRFVSSGTEATMTAVRLARAFTGKAKIIKFDGCYHGHFDSLLVKSGSGNLTLGIPSGEGILPGYSRDTVSIPFNNVTLFKQAVEKNKNEIACVIVEPVLCNAGVILPDKEFLKILAQITKQEKIILIFDEVITGFRLSLGGAQGLFNIRPDLTCLGKIIGGGFPLAAVGGRKDIMDLLAPVGPVYQAGTLSGNPVAVAAGLKTLECLEDNKTIYKDLKKKTAELVCSIQSEVNTLGIAVTVNSIGSVFSIFFTDRSVESYKDTINTDKARYAQFFRGLCQEGILFPPSAFEACFVSASHDEAAIEKTAKAIKKTFRTMRSAR